MKIHRHSKAFSLVELLAVIAIIGIMAAIIGVSLKPAEGRNLKSAQASAMSMFQAARTVASMRRTEARVIIFKDGNGVDAESKFLRYMGVVYWEKDPDGVSGKWVAANSGVYLPQGTYYIPDGSVGSFVKPGEDATETIYASDLVATENISYPVSSGTADEWYYYAFDGSGSAREENESTENPPDSRGRSFAGRAVIFASGRLEPGSSDPQVIIDNPLSTTGFVIRRIGGVLAINEYDQMENL